MKPVSPPLPSYAILYHHQHNINNTFSIITNKDSGTGPDTDTPDVTPPRERPLHTTYNTTADKVTNIISIYTPISRKKSPEGGSHKTKKRRRLR